MKLKLLILLLCISFSGFAQKKTKTKHKIHVLNAKEITKISISNSVKIHKVTTKAKIVDVLAILRKSPNDYFLVTYKGETVYGITSYYNSKTHEKLQRLCEKYCRIALPDCESILAISMGKRCGCECMSNLFEDDLDSIIDREDLNNS
jgi:hypothetical protein